MEKRKIKFSNITIAIIILLCLIAVDIYFYISFEKSITKALFKRMEVFLPIAGIVLTLLFWIGGCNFIYRITTRADRIKERVSFYLNILKFGLDNGLDDQKILKALYEERRRGKKAFSKAKNGLAEGNSLSEVLSADRKIFPVSTISIIKAGEGMGNLPSMVSYAKESLNLDRMIQTRMAIQFVYPLLVFIYILSLLQFLTTFIYPEFSEMIADYASGSLPAMTFSWQSYVVIGGMISFWLISYFYFSHTFSRKKNHLTFMQILSSALALNLEEKKALELAAQSSSTGKQVSKAKTFLQEGFPIDEAIARSFPQGEEMGWFFKQSRHSDAGEVFKAWSGILKDRLDRRADLYAQILSTMLIFSAGVCVWLITASIFKFLISMIDIVSM